MVPVYRFPLLESEVVSLRHLKHYLGHQDIVVVAPTSLNIQESYLASQRIVRFADRYFSSIQGYNELMLFPDFYRAFSAYEYILIYQLDALAFSRDLDHWCERGWDYVGAPWFRGFKDDASKGLWRTGNGGLSLRRVAKFLEVLASRRPGKLPEDLRETRFLHGQPQLQERFYRVKEWAYRKGYKNTVRYLRRAYELNEDGFWSFEAARFVDEFVVAPPDDALGFAFEYSPRVCYELNGRSLPFGCHAWHKIDPEFWRPFVVAA